MSDITKTDILNSLKKVDNPHFKKELLILNSIKKIETKGKRFNCRCSSIIVPVRSK